KRPQDRIELDALKKTFLDMMQAPAPSGYGKGFNELERRPRATIVGVGSEHRGMTIAGGGAQDTVPTPKLSAKRNTSEQTEEEMVNNRPTPDRVEAGSLA